MWVRYLKNKPGIPRNSVSWFEDDTEAITLIKQGDVARVIGPNGVSFEEAAPEDMIEQASREEGKNFKDMEKEFERRRNNKEDRDKDAKKEKEKDKDKPVKESGRSRNSKERR